MEQRTLHARLAGPLRAVVLVAVGVVAAVGAAGAADEPTAATLFASGDFDAAATAYATILTAHPGDPVASMRLGAIRLYQNDLTAAEPLLHAALADPATRERAARQLVELDRRRAEAARRSTVDGDEADVPFVTADPLPVVRVVANGKAGTFLVDTGADVALEPDFAANAGVATESAGIGVFAGGKQAPLQAGVLHSLALGSAIAYDVPVHVLPTHAGSLFPSVHIDGIVGTTYFERFLATIDYPNNRLVIRPRSTVNSAVFQAAADTDHETVVPFWLVGDHFVFAPAQVNDAPPGLFLFDSGLAGGGLMPTKALVAAAHISLDEAHAGTGIGGGGTVTAIPFIAKRIAVGMAVQANVPGIYTPEDSRPASFAFTSWGFVSNDFLKHYAYTVDFDAMKIVLEAPTAP